VSEDDNCHYTGTTKVPEEESLEATSESRHRGCRRDMLGQTVPSARSSNTEG